MKIGGMGMAELLIILAVVLLIFGPKNLPKLGSALGKTVKGLRDGMGSTKKKTEETADKKEAVEVEVDEGSEQKATAKKSEEKVAATEKTSE